MSSTPPPRESVSPSRSDAAKDAPSTRGTVGDQDAAKPAESREITSPPSNSADRRVEIRGEHRISADVIEVEELVQFRERLEQITRDLVDEYSRIIAMRRPSSD